MASMNELISDVNTRLSMGSGVGAQIYSEDRIALAINEAFVTIFEKEFWRRYYVQEEFTLDGSTGVVTATLTGKIKDFNDIKGIWLPNYSQQLPVAPKNKNWSNIRRPAVAATNTSKIFKIVPPDTTGNVVVGYRTRPDADFVGEEEVPMDRHMLIYRACYDIMIDLGTNEAATQKFLALYNQRYESLRDMENSGEIALGGYETAIGLDQWQERYP